MTVKNKKLKAWVVTVDMGYGHQRAAYPLAPIAYQGIINANNYPGIPESDKNIWLNQRKFYEFISRFKRVPLIGNAVFSVFDWAQQIPKFYPKRDLSRSNIQVLSATYLIKNEHWGRDLIKKLSRNPLPLITTFFATAMMAEINQYPGEIFCVICDADVSRSWVAENPQASRIKYLAPNIRVVERLGQYGVDKSRIFLTGFPLPNENLGRPSFKTLRGDLAKRLLNLDPNRLYLDKYRETLLKNLKIKSLPKQSDHILTLTFAVGGAGAQRELGVEIVKYLSQRIRSKEIKINLVAGVQQQVNQYFKDEIKKIGFSGQAGSGVEILYQKEKADYFKEFNQLLRTTDILWTKPSELSFYCALGLPIVIASPIGSQEDFNEQWLIYLGAGIKQENARYVDQWLFDWIKSGRLAEAASQGFLEAPRMGTYNIEMILSKEIEKAKNIETISQY